MKFYLTTLFFIVAFATTTTGQQSSKLLLRGSSGGGTPSSNGDDDHSSNVIHRQRVLQDDKKEEGESCTVVGDCQDGLYCYDNNGDGVKTCESSLVLVLCDTKVVNGECVKLDNNDECNSDSDCNSGFCTRDETIEENVLNIKSCGINLHGYGCGEDSHCKEGKCDNRVGQCIKLERNDICEVESDCASEICTNVATHVGNYKTCGIRLNDYGCDDDFDCKYGVCNRGQDKCVLQSDGRHCYHNKDCESNICGGPTGNKICMPVPVEPDTVRVAYMNDGGIYHVEYTKFWIKDMDGNTLEYKRFGGELEYYEYHYWVTTIDTPQESYRIKVEIQIESGEKKKKEFTVSGDVFDDRNDRAAACFYSKGTTFLNNRIRRSTDYDHWITHTDGEVKCS